MFRLDEMDALPRKSDPPAGMPTLADEHAGARQRPNAIFSIYHEIGDWVEACGLRVPDDFLVVQ